MFLKLYLIVLPLFFALDMFWIGVVAKNFYRHQIGFLMKTNINWMAAILFYLLFILGIVVFVVTPSLAKNSWSQALLFGALFGLITYATYDLTNLATIKNWPVLVTVIDLFYGAIIAALVSVGTFFIAKKIGIK